MKFLSTLFLLAVGAAAKSDNVRIKGVESSRKLSENYGYDNYNSNGYQTHTWSSVWSSSSSPHKPPPPKPKAKETKKPKSAPHKKAPPKPHSSGGGNGWQGGYGYDSGYGYDNSDSGHSSSDTAEMMYGAVGVLAIAGAIFGKKRCSSQNPAIDASEILQGDYENSDAAREDRHYVEMTDSQPHDPVIIEEEPVDEDAKSTTSSSIV